jgi:hypothetical protein
MKTQKEHLQEIIDHYEGWKISTKSFLKETESREDIDQARKDSLKEYYEKNLEDYNAKIKTIKSLMEGTAA